MLSKWDKCDGAEAWDLSILIAKKYLMEKEYFNNMAQHENIIDSWIEEMPNTIFTIYSYEDAIDIKMSIASMEKLKELMIIKSDEYITDNYNAALAQRIKEKLKSLTISIID